VTESDLEAILQAVPCRWRHGERSGMYYAAVTGLPAELVCTLSGTDLELLFRPTEEPCDTSRELLEYYLQLASDFAVFRLFLDQRDRLNLFGLWPRDELDVGLASWMITEFIQYCDYLVERLA